MSIFNKKSKEENNAVNEAEVATAPILTLGEKIAAARKEKGYTQEEFSGFLGVTSQAVSKWENDISCPDIMLLPKISQLLGISIDELLGNVVPPSQPEEPAKPKPDINKFSLSITVTSENKKPVHVSFPLAMVKKFTKLGTGISGILNVGSPAVDSKKIEKIFDLVDEGVTGEVLNMTDENGQNIVIEIKSL